MGFTTIELFCVQISNTNLFSVNVQNPENDKLTSKGELKQFRRLGILKLSKLQIINYYNMTIEDKQIFLYQQLVYMLTKDSKV